MFIEIALVLWSVAGLAWWMIAWRLVRANRGAEGPPAVTAEPRSLSIFKPLPPLGTRGLEEIAAALESFVAQLEPESELLLGVRQCDRVTVAHFVEAMRAKYPKARVRPVFRSEPDVVPNPKIAWQMLLAPHATGELWLWSDADIVAPPGFLQTACAQFARSGAAMMTFPYVVRRTARPGALLEALFVNAEFYPGVLLLRHFGEVDFGLGAGMLFERDEFLKCVDWTELGEFLADDFQLGQRLRPVRIGAAMLETLPSGRKWSDALQHDLRWAKTIRWNRPGGFFARLLVMPVTGWLIAVAGHPLNIFAWVGLLGMIQAEMMATTLICHGIGCRVKWRDWMILECWSFWRIAVWIVSWLPGPVVWRGQAWYGPRAGLPKSSEVVSERKPLTFHD
ncbi:MAG TPA: glycosyltransferase [Candidatus Methylacidiphilales bacterium]|jgi:ceramide glucosyltransferase|nr:glycosyltransferase [Candidatus Methylacidiphilales bacterium]